MDSPLTISIVAPVYGVEKYIERFAESLLGQSYPHIQFIFVNDGTKDSSMNILNRLIDEKHSHLRDNIVIVNKENEGLPAARRTGMDYVTGDYFWHVDSDDWISDDAVLMIVQEIRRTGADVVYFDFVKEYAKGPRIKREKDYSGSSRLKFIKDIFNHKAHGCTWNKCFRTSLFSESQIHTPKYPYGEDPYLTLQLIARAKDISHLKEVLYHYRKDNPQAITNQARSRRHREYVLNFMDLYEHYKGMPVEDNPLAVLYRPILRRARWYNLIHRLGLQIKK